MKPSTESAAALTSDERLADEIEGEGIERVVYGMDMTALKKLNWQLIDALRRTPSSEAVASPTDEEIKAVLIAYEAAVYEEGDNAEGVDFHRTALLAVLRRCMDARTSAAPAEAVAKLEGDVEALTRHHANALEMVRERERELASLRPAARRTYPGLWDDAKLGQELEGIIAMRTNFTGEPPYVGNAGVVLALNEALDELKSLRSATRRMGPETCSAPNGAIINMTLDGSGKWYCHGCGANQLEPNCRFSKSVPKNPSHGTRGGPEGEGP